MTKTWKNTVIAGLANYIDGGSILAGAVALPLWSIQYHLGHIFVGLIAAFSANAIAAGIGALIGGILCDRYGRKTIYQYDMLLYAFGMTWLVFAAVPWMIVVGVVLVGLAVGADIPASWSLIAELSPAAQRGRHGGMAQVLWYAGPLTVLILYLVLPAGILGARLVFAYLGVLAVVLTLLRSQMEESKVWETAKQAKSDSKLDGMKPSLWDYRHVRSMLFLTGMYGIWNLWAGTIGFFFPYFLREVGGYGQSIAVSIQVLGYVCGILSIVLVFMKFVDRVNQRVLFAASVSTQIVGTVLLAVLPLTVPVLILFTVLCSASGGGAQAYFQLWSAELFPTLHRATAQGIMFGAVRISLGMWSLAVPALAVTNFHGLVWVLAGFLALSGLLGVLGAPRQKSVSYFNAANREAISGSDPIGSADP